ncbi:MULTISPECIES: hypothetical protein [Prauserella salsuginis group]|uniref:Glycosyl transferase family 2 n=1 Tax=Prauserella salsuginis TaxID=387889 RepID=A0ABW6G047_9PSEU|nr:MULTISPECIES: hypothetical protein [Prauserella salsuginis group]MCR3721179.1 hypothetical protein [Prauserella flava]MCR3734740.1 hypothetical protein [Prauserella salsuginis]
MSTPDIVEPGETYSVPAASPSGAPVVIVVPAAAHGTVAQIVTQAEHAVHVALGWHTPVCTVLVDTSAPADTRAREAFLSSLTGCSRHAVACPRAGWGAAVARGFRHALHLQASLVVVDADKPTGEDAFAYHLPLSTAITMLREQALPGVVCSPLARPWWQRQLTTHVLRPLLAPGLGLTLVDPDARTLVLSPRAVQIAPNPRWRLDTLPGEQGLTVLAAARYAGMDLDQGPPRTPSITLDQLSSDVGDLADHDRGLGLLEAALATARLARAVPANAVPPWTADLVPANVADHDVLDRALAFAADARASPPGAAMPRAGDWPGPLIEAWYAARGLSPNLNAIACRLWDAYTHRVHAWLRAAVRLDAHPARLRQSVIAANTEFLTATATPINPVTTPAMENHEHHRLPQAS